MLITADYTCTTSFANVVSGSTPVQITLPTAGTWLLMASVRGQCGQVYGSAGQSLFVSSILYDTTNSVSLTNTQGIVFFTSLSAAVASGSAYAAIGFGPTPPFFYTVTGPAQINLQAKYTATASFNTTPLIVSDSNGPTTLAAVRIA